MKHHRTEQEDLEIVSRAIMDAPPITLEFHALDVFNLIGLLQFASRGLPANHSLRPVCDAFARQFQTAIRRAAGDEVNDIIELGFDPANDIIQTDAAGQPVIVQVHNCWTIYGANPDGSPSETKLACFERSQDWGHPRWQYTRFRFDWLAPDGKHYINHAHCWTDIPGLKPGDLPELFSSLVVKVMMPGHQEQLCGRDYLHPEDFWDKEWGQMPPFFEPDEGEDWE